MDLKFVCMVVCLCALTNMSTEAGIPKCCITTKSYIPKSVLRNVESWYMQEDNGVCDISALVLFFKDQKRPVCAPVKYRRLLTRMQQWKTKRTPQ